MSDATYEEVQITVETGEMLKRLADSLYPRPDVAIRELLANSVDSLLIKRDRVKRGEVDDDGRWQVKVQYDPMRNILTVADTGAGMTDADVRNYINRIGISGTQKYATDTGSRDVFKQLIGQFGIGLLACFKLGANLTITTRSVAGDDGMGTEWKSTGAEPRAKMRPLKLAQTGTTISLEVTDERNHKLLQEHLQTLVRHYGDLLPFPIVDNYGNQLNSHGKVPWEVSQPDEDTHCRALKEYIVERAKPERINDPLWVIPIKPTDKVQMAGVVYIPHDPSFGNINQAADLYVRRMLVKTDLPGILPEHLFFCQAVVDCADLTMIMAREDVMRDSAFTLFCAELERQIMGGLRTLATQQKDFQRTQACFDRELKAGVYQSDAVFDALADAICFRLVGLNEWQSLKEYCAEAKQNRHDEETRNAIYYMSSVSSPHEGHQVQLLLQEQKLKALEIHALPAQVSDDGHVEVPSSLDRAVLEKYADKRDKRLVPATDAVKAFEDTSDAQWQVLKQLFYAILPARESMELRVCGFAPTDLPVLLRTEDVSKLVQRIKAMESAVASFHKASGHEDGHIDGASDVLKAAQREALREAQKVQVVLNSENKLMQDFMNTLNDEHYRKYDATLEDAKKIAGELYHLALQYSGYQASGVGMQTILSWRCGLVSRHIKLLQLTAGMQS